MCKTPAGLWAPRSPVLTHLSCQEFRLSKGTAITTG